MTTHERAPGLDTMIDLHPAAERLVDLLANVDDPAFPSVTPCPDAHLGDLVDHIASLSRVFADVARGEPGVAGGPPSAANLPPDWRAETTSQLRELADAWADPDAWEGERHVAGLAMPARVAGLIALDELVVHGWDVAVATGQPYEPADADVAAATELVRSFDAPRDGSLFGPEVPVPPDAPALDRLLGLAGRDPGWQPPVRRTAP